METYFFHGLVLPQRAQFTHEFKLTHASLGSGRIVNISANILNNEIALWADCDGEWNIFDLRNVIRYVLRNEIATMGFILGYTYDLEITRVVNRGLGVDQVFGIDIPVINARIQGVDVNSRYQFLNTKRAGEFGAYIHRCFEDLVTALRVPEEVGFYCYRAIESLKQHCSAKHNLQPSDDAIQWAKFREVAGVDRGIIMEIKGAADPIRHGGHLAIDTDLHSRILVNSWDIADAYLANS